MKGLALATLLAAGCSFVFVEGPPRNHRQLPYFACTSSRVAPIIDGGLAALLALNMILTAVTSEADWNEAYDGDPPLGRGAVIGIDAALVAAYGAGAWFGFTRTSRCRAAKVELMGRVGAQPPGTWPPQPGQPPPPAQPQMPELPSD